MTTSIELYNGWLGDGLFASVSSPDLAVSKMQAFERSGLERLNHVDLNKLDTYVRTYDSSSSYRLSATIEAKGKIDLGIADEIRQEVLLNGCEQELQARGGSEVFSFDGPSQKSQKPRALHRVLAHSTIGLIAIRLKFSRSATVSLHCTFLVVPR
ncbi:hypothetical protein NDN08_006514 [Rhodosorus marinus]|uniref:Uncharacterized protein n=1 Tax=Rhodosorus marinus TaxID=101924 RepID=A0AAV8UHY3_9RHOD|nr:hypothetical protein NDN08_006514 [Rhodosorus marinus]